MIKPQEPSKNLSLDPTSGAMGAGIKNSSDNELCRYVPQCIHGKPSIVDDGTDEK